MSDDTHVCFTSDDFTTQEVVEAEENRTGMAYYVVVQGLSVCKRCKDAESGLSKPCAGSFEARIARDS